MTVTPAERCRIYRARKRRGVVGLARVDVTRDDLDRLDRFGLLPKVREGETWTDAQVVAAIHGALRRLAGLEDAMRTLREADQPPQPKVRPDRGRVSLAVGFIATAVALVIGVTWGNAARRPSDRVI